MVKKYVLWAMVIAVMAIIFKFSSEPAAVSNGTSKGFTYNILSLSESFNGLPEEEKQEIVESIQTIVRKGAHFSVYALLGFLLFNAFSLSGVKFFPAAPIFAAVYAALDEIHQLFVFGRSGEAADVILDFVGALCGAFLASMTMRVIRKIRGRRENG